MKSLDVAALAAAATLANPGRPATAIVHDSADARLVVFRIGAGQAVAPHTSPSSVIMVITAGRGWVQGDPDERAVAAGDVISFAPDERHGMRAGAEELVVLAIIAPRPGARS